MNKRVLFLSLFFILLLNYVYAQDITVEDKAIVDTITLDQKAIYTLSIKNNQNFDDTFTFKFLDISWTLVSEPQSISLGPGQTREVKITLYPVNIRPSTYSVPITIQGSKTQSSHGVIVKLLNYRGLIKPSIVLSESIDPRKSTIIKLDLKNDYDISVKDLVISLTSDFFTFNRTVSLAPYETKTEEFIIELDPETQKGSYLVKASLSYNNNFVGESQEYMQILQYPGTKALETPSIGFLTTTKSVIKSNDGNAPITERYSVVLSRADKLFTTTNIKPTSINYEDGKYVYEWVFELQPGEQKEIVVKTNYQAPIFVILIVVIIIILAFNFIRVDVSLTKKVLLVKHEKGGPAIIKVLLILKNHRNQAVHNVVVNDRISSLIEPIQEFGTLKPDKISEQGDHVRLSWSISVLPRKEERIITYRAKSKFSVIGSNIAPVAIARYTLNNKTKTIRSNRASV